MSEDMIMKAELMERYRTIEKERSELKQVWCHLKEIKGDKNEIKRIGKRLTELTLNQAHIMIDLERLV